MRDVEQVIDATGSSSPRASSIRTVIRTARCSSMGRLPATSARGSRPSCPGNCGDTLAPITDAGRELVDAVACGRTSSWRAGERSGSTSDAVDEQALGPNVAFLVGPRDRPGVRAGRRGRARATDDGARDDGARGRGGAWRPGRSGCRQRADLRARDARRRRPRSQALVAAAARRGGLYATHMRNEGDGLFASLDESIATVRSARDAGAAARGSRSRTSSAASRAVWGRAGEAIARLEAARPTAWTWPPTSIPTRPRRRRSRPSCRRRLLGLGVEELRRGAGRPRGPSTGSRRRWSAGSRAGRTWPRTRAGPASASRCAPSHPDWAGRSLAELGDELERDPAELAFDALIDDRLDVSVVIDCMDDADVETIMAVPWIAVCTDAEGRRPGHPILDAGRPHPRTYGSTARVLGHVRARARHARRSRRPSRS